VLVHRTGAYCHKKGPDETIILPVYIWWPNDQKLWCACFISRC